MTDELTLRGLPAVCAARSETNGTVIIKRGEDGMWPSSSIASPEEWNVKHGITPEQAAAMVAGSMFGWHIPLADPAEWTTAQARAMAY